MGQIIDSSIYINAPAQRVWRVLLDFAAYPLWNPYLSIVEGQAQLNQTLHILSFPPQAKPMEYYTKIRCIDENHRLAWVCCLIMPGFCDIEHEFKLYTMGLQRVQFTQTKRFSGLLSAIVSRLLWSDIQLGLECMNRALKHRVEQQNQGFNNLSAVSVVSVAVDI